MLVHFMKPLGPLRNAWNSSSQLRFVAIGAANTFFGYGSFAALYLLAGRWIHYLIISVIAHFLAVANAFYWHRRVTFRSDEQYLPAFFRFNLGYVGFLAFGLVTMPALVEGLGFHPLVASVCIMLVTVVASYFLHRNFSFRDRN
jgi:putative flippase GtrA